MKDRLVELAEICASLRHEIQSPHDASVEAALFLILQELQELRAHLGLGQ